jgi:hypothetical protein
MCCRCPLCLRELSDGHQIARFCPAHPELSETLTIDAEAAPSLACPEPNCRSYGVIGLKGLMLRHVGCPRGRNPFWDAQAKQIMVSDSIVSPVTSDQERVGHWEIDALREIGRRQPAAEMWFPAPLLLKEPNPVEPRSQVLVDFTGARGVGKTFLAMHALDTDGYTNGDAPTGDFIYSVPAAGADGAREFLLTLRLRERMALNQEFNEWIRMSTVRPRNLKAAFFATGHTTDPEQSQGLFGRAFTELSDAYRHIADALSADGPPTVQRALLMYDIAGETSERYADPTIVEHDGDMDVLAVLVSAADLTAQAARELDSVYVAAHRLQQIAAAKQHRPGLRCALIVTKCDLWQGSRPTQPSVDDLMEYATSEKAHPGLRDLVRRCQPDAHGRALVDRVWFTWPEDNGKPGAAIHGLEDFVKWCFES